MNFNKVILILLLVGLPTVCRAQPAETTEKTETRAEAWYEPNWKNESRLSRSLT
jgi:hypothetical protein